MQFMQRMNALCYLACLLHKGLYPSISALNVCQIFDKVKEDPAFKWLLIATFTT